MGREATCHARWSGGSGQVKALLETHEVILRGDLRRIMPIEAIAAHVDGDDLVLRVGDEAVALELGASTAASWLRKIETPPPTLAAKLGVGPDCRALVCGEVEDAHLEEALRTALATAPGEARLTLAVVESEDQLAAALDCHGQLPDDAPIWLINVKGPKSPFGEAAIRSIMRARGFVDTKTASVSDVLAGTRYSRRRG